MHKIQISSETFNNCEIKERLIIIELAKHKLGNDFNIDIVDPLPGGGFRVTGDNKIMDVDENTFFDFAILAVDDCDADNYGFWVDSWRESNEVVYTINLLIMCERIAKQLETMDCAAIPPEVNDRHMKGAHMYDSVPFPMPENMN